MELRLFVQKRKEECNGHFSVNFVIMLIINLWVWTFKSTVCPGLAFTLKIVTPLEKLRLKCANSVKFLLLFNAISLNSASL